MTSLSLQQSTSVDCAPHQRYETSKSTNCAALGWVAMLLALSQAAAFSTSGLQPELAATSCVREKSSMPGSCRIRTSSLFGSRTSPTMSYDKAAMAPPRTTRRFPLPIAQWSRTEARTGSERLATRLQYRDGDGDESEPRQSEHDDATQALQPEARWWQTVFQRPTPPPTHDQQQQESVDEYLEFLDRRYKRLHHLEEPKARPAQQTKSSLLGWLTGETRHDKNVVTLQQQEDALYVLGVAELASERLLQKHQVSLQPQEDLMSSNEVIIDASSMDVDDTASEVTNIISTSQGQVMMVAAFVESAKALLKRIKAHRRALIATEERQVRRLFALATKALVAAPAHVVAAFHNLWRMSGGKRTFAVTVSAFVTVFVLARPMAEAIVREGLLDA